MEEKIYQILKKHKLPLKKRKELIIDLLSLLNVSGSIPNTDDLDVTMCPQCQSTDIVFHTGILNKCNECGNGFA